VLCLYKIVKRSVGDSDLAGGEGPKKAKTPLDVWSLRSRRLRTTLIARAVLTVQTKITKPQI